MQVAAFGKLSGDDKFAQQFKARLPKRTSRIADIDDVPSTDPRTGKSQLHPNGERRAYTVAEVARISCEAIVETSKVVAFFMHGVIYWALELTNGVAPPQSALGGDGWVSRSALGGGSARVFQRH